jgi:L-alanine-DL-glutamate epimerase-like enolase superfamily enzyme
MSGPGTELVVRDVVVRPVVVPFRRPLATKVGHFAQWPLLLIDITTEQGITGHGTLEPGPAYNSNGLGLIPPAAVADEALELLAEGGFTALKVRVGRDRAADDLEAVRRVRAAVGDEVTLVADYNQGLALGDALERCRARRGGADLDRGAAAL